MKIHRHFYCFKYEAWLKKLQRREHVKKIRKKDIQKERNIEGNVENIEERKEGRKGEKAAWKERRKQRMKEKGRNEGKSKRTKKKSDGKTFPFPSIKKEREKEDRRRHKSTYPDLENIEIKPHTFLEKVLRFDFMFISLPSCPLGMLRWHIPNMQRSPRTHWVSLLQYWPSPRKGTQRPKWRSHEKPRPQVLSLSHTVCRQNKINFFKIPVQNV